jgi:hypothetical protein
MASPAQRALVASCLQSNAASIRLLQKGISYDRCLFPINLADGWNALLPHLESCARGAHLLALESIENQYDGDPEKAAASVMASLHMAEILRDEPELLGILIRNRILVTGCLSIQSSLQAAPFSANELASISARLQSAMESSQAALPTALVVERCMGFSVFQSSDREIADFLSQGEGSPVLVFSVEGLRMMGILQRDAAYYVDFIDRIETACTNSSRQTTLAQLADIASQVEQNRQFASRGDRQQLNVISCMLLPGTIRAIQSDIWTHTLGQVTVASLAVERHRRELGRLPADLGELVPRYLSKVPEDPFTGRPISFRLLPKGYSVYASAASGRNSDPGGQAGAAVSQSDDIICTVTR